MYTLCCFSDYVIIFYQIDKEIRPVPLGHPQSLEDRHDETSINNIAATIKSNFFISRMLCRYKIR